MQFQAICSKANKKLTLSLVAADIEEARALLHGQGYSIMELKEKAMEAENPDSKSNYFYFDIVVNGQIKTGKIQSDDVFKSYKKLIEDLGYNVVYIYTNEGMNEAQKKVITAKVRDSYRMYKTSVGEDIDEVKETIDQMEIHEISPEILRQVEQYSLIIDSTLEKIQNLILKYHTTIPLDKKLDLEEIEHQLLGAKGSSNIGKIKLIVENALNNIGQIELELTKTNNAEEKKKFLQETNSLLKQIGSSNRIETTDTPTFEKSVSDFVSKFKRKEAPEKKETKKVDTNSFIYYKNQRELNIYREILGKNDVLIMKMIFTLQWGKVKRLFLKKKLLQQNIQIIDNRIHNRNISYTKVVKGVQYYIDLFINTISYIARTGSYILFLYILTLLVLKIGAYFGIVQYGFQENKSILYITLFSVVMLLFSFIRSIGGFIGGMIILYISLIFLSINF